MMQLASSQINYWDRVAHEKRFSHPLRLEWLAPYLDSRARVIDFGCGYGRTLAELSQAGFANITGLDFSEQMLARCRAEVPGVKLVQNDGHTLPLKTNSIDMILLFAVLTCVPYGDAQRALIGESQRVLRSGGLIYLSDLLLNTDQRNLERYEMHARAHGCYGIFELPEGIVVRHHSQEWIQELTRQFHQLKFEPFTVTTMNGNSSAAFQYLGRKSEARQSS
jgi:ubiquinone/menaquinone biosynthesis C-methylase UbiE